MKEPKWIRNNKCVVGETYYLDGGWYDYNFSFNLSEEPYVTSKNNIPMINTPVKFVGKVSKSGPRFRFEYDGKFLHDYATGTMNIEPIENPEILKTISNE